ncbi:disulfide bond formation protein B [Stenotrophomonas ginsengisoli]|uniref:Disulfide bond formation protein B n=1 Tax=Stenotrophomonas ginsengisoli TaxID=336566 RepID=A0A0R0DBJ0_9GAMM|nr:disulfide bond formation protein B [Stenotrophomonas ginsengisoli]KRG75137.1 disulfide bond formation protein B [Stenotrophomonas ginsengisoli]
MNPLRWNFRLQMFAGAGVCAALLAFAIYTQMRLGLEPCSLCIYQRLAFAALGVVFVLAGLHGPRNRAGRATYGVLGVIAAAVGAGIATRHVWVQSQPQDFMTSCGPPLSFLNETMGPFEAFRTVLTATGNCGDIDWTFLGLTMPMWCLVWFVVLGLWALACGLRKGKGAR